MKPVRFDYKRPATIDEACGLLAGDDNARILAGGQSLIPMLSMRLSRPSLLIDIAHIPELTTFVETETHIEIGAMVRQAVAQKSELVKNAYSAFGKGAWPCWPSANARARHGWRLGGACRSFG